MSLTIWSAQRSGGRPLGRCHVEGGVEGQNVDGLSAGCRRQMCPNCCRYGWLSCADENRCVCDVIVPADAHYAAECFCVEGIEAFLLRF